MAYIPEFCRPIEVIGSGENRPTLGLSKTPQDRKQLIGSGVFHSGTALGLATVRDKIHFLQQQIYTSGHDKRGQLSRWGFTLRTALVLPIVSALSHPKQKKALGAMAVAVLLGTLTMAGCSAPATASAYNPCTPEIVAQASYHCSPDHYNAGLCQVLHTRRLRKTVTADRVLKKGSTVCIVYLGEKDGIPEYAYPVFPSEGESPVLITEKQLKKIPIGSCYNLYDAGFYPCPKKESRISQRWQKLKEDVAEYSGWVGVGLIISILSLFGYQTKKAWNNRKTKKEQPKHQ